MAQPPFSNAGLSGSEEIWETLPLPTGGPFGLYGANCSEAKQYREDRNGSN